MAKAFKFRVGYLVPELLAYALVIVDPLPAAGAITPCALQAFPDCFYNFFVRIKCNCHTFLHLSMIVSPSGKYKPP
jgi:hypothetical protein